uniref:Uncharacterized protein n=1 Tax=Molossus molossus TaxID=27622 RepID=A0A7J8HZX1_MOLMO|nr:hypothetical protein HJG59_010818 [Molossus molossus]
MAFILKSILSDISIAIPAFFSFPFAWKIFFHPFTFNLCESFVVTWVSCKKHISESCFFIQSATLCLFMGAFNPFTFKVIIDMYLFIAIFVYCGYIFLSISPDNYSSLFNISCSAGLVLMYSLSLLFLTWKALYLTFYFE